MTCIDFIRDLLARCPGIPSITVKQFHEDCAPQWSRQTVSKALKTLCDDPSTGLYLISYGELEGSDCYRRTGLHHRTTVLVGTLEKP